jgi:hypothetical protein|tara:strand:+ start:5106 stop:5558 length:453 start_codon:yes stop_codon:yes gene_type:complete
MRPSFATPRAATPRAATPRAARATRTTPRRAATPTRATRDDRARDLFAKLYRGGGGKQIYYGVFQRDAPASATKSEEARARSRDEAAKTLTNIDAEERGRRMEVGKAAGAATAALAAAQLALGATRVERLAIAVPLFFALGFVGSAKTGL